MKYALGNMLNGGVMSADGLALDLQFAADKSLVARKGPTPTFTRASSATFVGSNGLIQSAATNVARFDHDPVTLASRGLLIEESRTNSLPQSEDLTQAIWGKQGCTISANAIAAPDGATTADGIVDDTTTGPHRVTQTINVTSGVTYTASCFIKRNQVADFFQMAFSSAFFGTNSTYFNISNGTIASTSGTAATPTITAYPNGWYRVTHTVTCITSSTGATAFINPTTSSTSFNYTGTGVLTVYLWGAQLETGAFATSYIPTVASSVVRSADVCSITGAEFSGFYSQPEGTMLVNGFTPASGDRTIVTSDDNTANEMIRLRTEATNPFFKVTDGGSELVAIDAGAVAANISFKLAGAYKLNDFASSINGGSVVIDTSGTIPTVDRMRIGSGQSGNTMCGCVSSLRYYKKRLVDSKLQALTA